MIASAFSAGVSTIVPQRAKPDRLRDRQCIDNNGIGKDGAIASIVNVTSGEETKQ
jgi:hypothetical protein